MFFYESIKLIILKSLWGPYCPVNEYFSFPLLPIMALGAVVDPGSLRTISACSSPQFDFWDIKNGDQPSSYFQIKLKIWLCIYIFIYTCPIFKFNFNILKIIWYKFYLKSHFISLSNLKFLLNELLEMEL